MTNERDALVWGEIPVSDLAAATAFYSAAMNVPLSITEDMGPMKMTVFPYAGGEGVSGHLAEGIPAKDGQGPVLHILIQGTLADAAQRVRAAGGETDAVEYPVPSGKFIYARDLDGNKFGLYVSNSAT